MAYPEKLQQVIEMFDLFDTADRTSMLVSYADQFREVPQSVATRPFSKSHQVPHCESDASVHVAATEQWTTAVHA